MDSPAIGNLDPETISVILWWAVTILVAGFIAQFGKKFANYLTEKIRSLGKNSGKIQPGDEAAPGQRAGGAPDAERARLKLEKKRAKAEAKKDKKMR